MSRRCIYCKGTLWFQKQVLWRWYHQDAFFKIDNIFIILAGKVFQQIGGIPMGKMRPSSSRHLSLLIRNGIHTGFALDGREAIGISVHFHVRIHWSCFVLNNTNFDNYLGQMYLVKLEIKDTTESNSSSSYLGILLSIGRNGQLRTSIYDKRDGFNYHITFSLCPSMAFLSQSLYDISGLGLHMDVLFWGQ